VDQPIRIGVVGDFHPALRMHLAIGESHQHAARQLGCQVVTEWVHTTAITKQNIAQVAGGFDGLWIAPASPYRSFEGALAAIEFARTRNWPLTGT
jgi:CTP synthase (UTP-ammonia lyase)